MGCKLGQQRRPPCCKAIIISAAAGLSLHFQELSHRRDDLGTAAVGESGGESKATRFPEGAEYHRLLGCSSHRGARRWNVLQLSSCERQACWVVQIDRWTESFPYMSNGAIVHYEPPLLQPTRKRKGGRALPSLRPPPHYARGVLSSLWPLNHMLLIRAFICHLSFHL